MREIESNYSDYDHVKHNEGGLHDGRSNPSRGLIVTLVMMLGLLIVASIVLALI